MDGVNLITQKWHPQPWIPIKILENENSALPRNWVHKLFCESMSVKAHFSFETSSLKQCLDLRVLLSLEVRLWQGWPFLDLAADYFVMILEINVFSIIYLPVQCFLKQSLLKSCFYNNRVCNCRVSHDHFWTYLCSITISGSMGSRCGSAVKWWKMRK
jgi:hypothetical protein